MPPSVTIAPPPDFQAKTFDDYMVLGMIMTAMPAIDAIAAVCAAEPGIDLTLEAVARLAHQRIADHARPTTCSRAVSTRMTTKTNRSSIA